MLDKHEEENSVIQAEQKRRITVLQDQANKLKIKVREAESSLEKERSQLAAGISAINTQLADLKAKQKKHGQRSAQVLTSFYSCSRHLYCRPGLTWPP